jgi:hypothetical protein
MLYIGSIESIEGKERNEPKSPFSEEIIRRPVKG